MILKLNEELKYYIKPVSTIDIKKGSELLIDYRFWEYREEWQLKEKCKCGSVNCNGFVNGSFYKTIDSNYTFYEYFSPSLKNKIKKI